MQHIHVLDKSVAERIAAGEVVERPASVVKELIENAIDAGATAISIEIREGGVALIRVGDNGSGMSRDDASLAVERFATSKIAGEKDLDSVRTLGFRGEALPSIASVSRLEILTRAREAQRDDKSKEVEGTRVAAVDGRLDIQVAGAPAGAQVTVRDLFYNAPARRKFLKAPLRETELIQKTVMLYALAYPQIAFRLVVDGREQLVAPAATPLERIGAVWGREAAAEMLEINYASVDLSVRGFVSRPALARASRDWQAFFVNGRPVRSGLLAVMLERPFAGRIPPNRHPLALIRIDLDPQLVDVNVHPRKAEVRFFQERAIYGAVAQAVEGALREFPSLPATSFAWPFQAREETETSRGISTLREAPSDYRAANWRAVAQVHNTYILAQASEGMVIVDQHAAQEQIFYERLTSDAYENVGTRRQGEMGMEESNSQLAIPNYELRIANYELVQLTTSESALLHDHLEEYRALGIDVEPFGENAFRVRVVPEFVTLEPGKLIAELLQEHERYRGLDGDALRDKLAAKAACLSAIKAGDALDNEQQQALLDELLQAYAPATCPHGRPVFVMLSWEELGRRFLRR